MITIWTKHIKDHDEKVQYEKSLRNSRWILEDLHALLQQMKDDVDSFETSTKQYDKPNWDVRQADNNGFKRCLKAVQRLITLDQKEEHDRQSTN